MDRTKVNNLVTAALFLCIGLVLPFFTGGQLFGAMLLPMHLPVLLCGIILGPKYGALVGLLLPITRFLMIGHPPLFPVAVSMTFELAAYGAIIGLLYIKLPKTIPYLYAALIGAMLAGRVVWGATMTVISGVSDVPFSFAMFMGGAFANAWSGIALQILVIPALIIALKKAGWAGGLSANQA